MGQTKEFKETLFAMFKLNFKSFLRLTSQFLLGSRGSKFDQKLFKVFHSFFTMKIAFLVFVSLCVGFSAARNVRMRVRRQTYLLPADVDKALYSPVKSTFVCSEPGYYADVDNNCQVFHVCDATIGPDGPELRQYSFACGNGTTFNQFSMTCDFTEEAVGCQYATEFFDLNRKIGTNKETPIHTATDIEENLQYVPHKLKYYHSPIDEKRSK